LVMSAANLRHLFGINELLTRGLVAIIKPLRCRAGYLISGIERMGIGSSPKVSQSVTNIQLLRLAKRKRTTTRIFETFPPQDCPVPRAKAMTVPDLMQRFDKFGTDIQKQDIEGAELDFSIRHPASVDKVRMIFAEVHDRLRLGFKAAFERSTGVKRNAATSSEKILSAAR
jgi:hypothetical protein